MGVKLSEGPRFTQVEGNDIQQTPKFTKILKPYIYGIRIVKSLTNQVFSMRPKWQYLVSRITAAIGDHSHHVHIVTYRFVWLNHPL